MTHKEKEGYEGANHVARNTGLTKNMVNEICLLPISRCWIWWIKKIIISDDFRADTNPGQQGKTGQGMPRSIKTNNFQGLATNKLLWDIPQT